MASDASGVYGYLVDSECKVLLSHLFTLEERLASSTFREIVTLRDIYLSEAAQSFKGSVVRHLTYNKADESVMRIGSRVPAIHDIFLAVFLKCRELNIMLIVEWRSRDDPAIQLADEGSRCFDKSSYGLDFDSFLCLVEFFRHLYLEVDCMAQASNNRCGRYFSRFPDPESEGRNFFSQKLVSTTTYYCFPPPSLIPASLLHFLKFEAHELFLVPCWPSCSFWSLLVPDGVHLTRGV